MKMNRSGLELSKKSAAASSGRTRSAGLLSVLATGLVALLIAPATRADVVFHQIMGVTESGHSVLATAPSVATLPGPRGAGTPIPYPNVTVTPVAPQTNTLTSSIGVKKVVPTGHSSILTIDFDTLLLPEESATFRIVLQTPGGDSLGPDFEVTADSTTTGRVSFDLARLPVQDVVLKFELTLLETSSDATSTFNISSVEADGVTFNSSPAAGEWAPAVNVGAPINTSFTETGAALSRGGRSLYFASNRPCGANDAVLDFNLWVSRRAGPNAPWQEPVCLSINADARVAGELPYQDREPTLSRDQHWLYFVSDRPGSLGPSVSGGGGDIWVSWRHDIHDDAGWCMPFRLIGRDLNTEASERTPHLFERFGALPQLIFSSSRSGVIDLYAVDILGGIAWGRPRPITELNTPDLLDSGGAVARGEREIYLFRGNPPAGIPLDIYVATRPQAHGPWSAPTPLGAGVNSPGNDQEVALSAFGNVLFFGSARAGSVPSATGAPSLDIWMSQRQPPVHDDEEEDGED